MMKLGWYHTLDQTERRTYWACFAGFGLDAMNTTIYALVIPALIATLGLTQAEAGYLATASSPGPRSAAGPPASWPTGSVGSESCRSPS
ncbi:hypothetical protein ACU4GA_30115 [Methylobacterium oryzae CBMB20]